MTLTGLAFKVYSKDPGVSKGLLLKEENSTI